MLFRSLSAAADEELRYLLGTVAAPDTLTCANGTVVASGANIEIPAGGSQGEVQYFYAVNCDLAGNKSSEIARTFTYDSINPNLPIASDLSAVFSVDFTLTLSISAPGIITPSSSIEKVIAGRRKAATWPWVDRATGLSKIISPNSLSLSTTNISRSTSLSDWACLPRA